MNLFFITLLLAVFASVIPEHTLATGMERVRVSEAKDGFVMEPSGHPLVPWGFNYDHDRDGRLLEDYWETEWATVEEDFREMKQLGANAVRIHLQLGKFMEAAGQPNEKALDRLGLLVDLAERENLYLDLTGLGCYHKPDVPDWYDGLPEEGRWQVQSAFWEAIAERCARSPSILCYDLMNEPVVPGRSREPGDWLGPAFAGKYFVQFVTLDPANRPRPEIARRWIQHLTAAIRKHDSRHMITVGLVPWSLDRSGMSSGFVPEKIVDLLDFICVHLYPKQSGLEEAMEILRGFSVGKPLVIEETFPLKCPVAEHEEFIEKSKGVAKGWFGFYWGKAPSEYRPPENLADSLTLGWLEFFEREAASRRAEDESSH
jgi:cellulase (glycosyl hydrolase family 5)